MAFLLGIDTGGTFTDAVVIEEARGVIGKAKALTTHHHLAAGIAAAAEGTLSASGVAGADLALVSVSTTLATNALVEGVRRPVGLLMLGFGAEDLRRAGLAEALGRDPVAHLAGGHDFAGRPLATPDPAAIAAFAREAAPAVQGFAVASLFATRNAEHELLARRILRECAGLPVTCSHELSRALDGPRRALTALLNARLIGLIADLVGAVRGVLEARAVRAPLMVVRGDGALIAAEVAVERPIETILSGPAATIVGAAWLSGVSDALVSDIGGTTTDIAVLRGGLPRASAEGAEVGGFRTMVEAVGMRTSGLGGDSAVRLERAGLKLAVELGPRRAMPVSLLASTHEAMVMEALRRQAERAAPSDIDGWFAIPAPGGRMANLSPTEARVLDAIPGPCAADAVARRRADVGALLRLWEKGAIALARVTPSDAAHVRGDHDAWHRDAARLALGLLARQRDGAGEAAFASAEAAAEAVIARLVRLSAEALIETAVAEEGEASPGLARHPLVARALEGRAGALIDLRPAFRLPIVAVGASASTYYPAVARMLGAELVTPPHADVANAVGAVVGKVRVAAEARVTQPEEGRFLVSFPNETRRFDALDAAMAHAAAQAEAAARLEAQRAGAFEPLVHLERAVKEIETEGLVVFVEAVIRAVAIGRPRLGQPDAVSSATTPGSGLPSIHSRNAPPAVET